jgi:hypothetical protein
LNILHSISKLRLSYNKRSIVPTLNNKTQLQKPDLPKDSDQIFFNLSISRNPPLKDPAFWFNKFNNFEMSLIPLIFEPDYSAEDGFGQGNQKDEALKTGSHELPTPRFEALNPSIVANIWDFEDLKHPNYRERHVPLDSGNLRKVFSLSTTITLSMNPKPTNGPLHS